MAAPLPCLVLSDGRRGIENQALGLAEAIGRLRPLDIQSVTLKNTHIFKALPPRLQLALRPRPHSYGLPEPAPKLIIGCGRQAIAPLLALKKTYGATVFTVYIQHPRLTPEHFDLVVAPFHDRLEGNNVLGMIGAPHRITPAGLAEAATAFRDRLSTLPSPRIAVLIGGPSKTRKLTRPIRDAHLQAVTDLLAKGHSVMLSTSRRTPEDVNTAWRELAGREDRLWFYDGHRPKGDNPYQAFLGAADAVLVSEESTNMLVEACASGKPVFRLPMAGRPGKFEHLYAALETRCHVRPYQGRLSAPPYPPLQETARIAAETLPRLRILDERTGG